MASEVFLQCFTRLLGHIRVYFHVYQEALLRRSEALQHSINAVLAVFDDLETGVFEIFNCYIFSYLDYRYQLDNSNSATNDLNVKRPFRQQPNSYGWARESTVYVETPLHPEKLTVWVRFMGWWNPYFFKNDEGHNVTVNGDRYRAMNTNFFIPELNNHDVQELWFQQDGATCHTARATIDLLKDTFGDRLISRFGPVNWPPRSCDLTPLDYFLWGYVVIGLCG
ncbi:uncharacterized protein TNCV_3010791 [Trichonephila clavipes]|nr:uncharacterized protein TNCV_3010791 [Trichonephila clavipes]